jgi:hypothetical protein
MPVDAAIAGEEARMKMSCDPRTMLATQPDFISWRASTKIRVLIKITPMGSIFASTPHNRHWHWCVAFLHDGVNVTCLRAENASKT